MKQTVISVVSSLRMGATALSPSSFATRIDLNGGWQFKQSKASEWHPANVPGAVHTDLMALEKISDPFFGVNEKDLQWVGEKDWEYINTFNITTDVLSSPGIDLVFEGLDTYAEVYINDVKALDADNMFRTWRINARPYLKEGDNVIRICFRSVFKEDMPKYLDAPFKLQAWPNNDQSDIPLSLYARKAGYNYGWDWGPRLITTGIWRPVYFELWDRIRIDGTHVATRSLGKSHASMEAICDVFSDSDGRASVTVAFDGGKETKDVTLKKGNNRVKVPFKVKNPKLWWTNGLGDHPLYDFDISVRTDGKEVLGRVTTGIRTVEVVRDRDKYGTSMKIRLNGKDVFMKGADWIPMDNFPNRVTEARYEQMLGSAADANMNMIRIWGGGIYEPDIFYDICDRKGILLWHDMMFACGMFPADDHYLNSVAEEVKDNVKRLRNHPSIALWCGNNENEISYFEWGWRGKYTPEQDRIYQSNLKKLFYEVIPEAIKDYDDTRYYHPTSPVTGYNGIGYGEGDAHFWWVWKGGWIEEYLKPENIARFMSEYGFQSYPEMKTIESFTREEDRHIDSEVMLSHQRARHDQTRDPNFGNNMMRMYMEKYFSVPESLDDFVYISQIMQAEAVKMAIESHRRSKPYCMGTLYWQIDDCWPVASWSSIDYYGRWKALHYTARDAYRDVIVSPYEREGKVAFKVVSDRMDPVSGELLVTTMTLDGGNVYSRRVSFSVGANGCDDVAVVEEKELYGNKNPEEVFTFVSILQNGKEISSNIWYPVYSNRYSYLEANPEIKVMPGGNEVILVASSPVLVRGLYFYLDGDGDDAFFSDNYVTLVPGKEHIMRVKTSLSPDILKKRLRFKTLNNLK